MAIIERRDKHGAPLTKDGKVLYFVVVNYRDHSGKRRQARKNATGISEANKVQRELLNMRDARELTDQIAPAVEPEAPRVLTVAEYLERWITGRKGEIGTSTIKRYRQSLAHVIDAVGPVPLPELTTLQIKSIYDGITSPVADGNGKVVRSARTAKTALNTHRVLKRALQDAIDIYALIERNPAIKQVAPRADNPKIEVVSLDALDRILAAAEQVDALRKPGEAKVAPLLRLITLTGLRLGEALALTWTNVNLETGQLSVRQTLNVAGEFGEPKTDRSRRTIGISPETVAMLHKMRRSQTADKLAAGPAYSDGGFVFADVLGGHRSQWAVNHEWRRILKRANETGPALKTRIHDLRHAHASHLLAKGWELSAVAERLGHSRTSTTLDFYSHALPDRNAELVGSVDAIFGVAK